MVDVMSIIPGLIPLCTPICGYMCLNCVTSVVDNSVYVVVFPFVSPSMDYNSYSFNINMGRTSVIGVIVCMITNVQVQRSTLHKCLM